MPTEDSNSAPPQPSTHPLQPVGINQQQTPSKSLEDKIHKPNQSLILSLFLAFLLSGILFFILDLFDSLSSSVIPIITIQFFISTFFSLKLNEPKDSKLLLKILAICTLLPIIILFIISIVQSAGCIGLGCIGPGLVIFGSFIYIFNLAVYLKLLNIIRDKIREKEYYRKLFYVFIIIAFLSLFINFTYNNFKFYTQKISATPLWTEFQISPYLELNRLTIKEFSYEGKLSNFRNGVQDDKYISSREGYYRNGWLNDDVIIYTKEGLNNKNKKYILSKNIKTNSDKLLAVLEGGGIELVASPNKDKIAITSILSQNTNKLRLDILNIDGSKWIYGDLTTCDDSWACPLSWTADGLLIVKDDYHVSKITF